jgi:Protein kinase domain
MGPKQFVPIAVATSSILLAVFMVIGGILSLILVVGAMVVLAGISEGLPNKSSKAGFLMITFMMDFAVFIFLLPGSYLNGILFAFVGVIIVLLSKGHMTRALAFTFLAYPILMGTFVPEAALTLEGRLPSGALTFAGFTLLLSTATIMVNIIPASVFRLTNIAHLRNSRLSNPTTGLYWSSAFSLYLLQNSQNTSLFSTLPETTAAWILLVVITEEGGGFISKLVLGRLRSAVAHSVTVNVLETGSRKPVSGALVDLGGRILVSGPAGTVTYTSVPAGTYTLGVGMPKYQRMTLTIAVPSNLNVDVLMRPLPVPPPSATHTVRVVISDSTNHDAITGAKVSLNGKTLTTGTDGTVTFKSVTAGTHNLVAAADKYQQSSIPISVTSDLNSDVLLTPVAQTQQEWPTIDQYVGAFQNFADHILIPGLRQGRVFPDFEGKPASWSGSNAVVFKLEIGGMNSAIRCFTPFPPDPEVEKRCNLISEYVGYARSPVLVDFHYYKEGLTINQTKYPIVIMDWVEGVTLHSYISDNYSLSNKMKELAAKFIDGIILLRKNKIAHGDLSSDNIMVTDDRTQGLRIKLVDYDAMYIPPFAGQLSPSKETGKPAFQHPLRTARNYSVRMDNFSCLVIYLSLLAISEKPELWEKYNAGDKEQRILFGEEDFASPTSSGAFKDVTSISNGKTKALLSLLKAALKEDPLWEQINPDRIDSA